MKLGKFVTITPTWGVIRITKNKSFEYQIEFKKFNNQPIELSFTWTTKEDHAGASFIFSIYKLFWMELSLRDCRHWNYEESKWEDAGDCHYQDSKWELPTDLNS